MRTPKQRVSIVLVDQSRCPVELRLANTSTSGFETYTKRVNSKFGPAFDLQSSNGGSHVDKSQV